MLAFAFPDELWYSCVARSYELLGPGCPRNFNRALFGTDAPQNGADAPLALCRAAGAIRGVADLLRDHTLLPVLAPFMEATRWGKLLTDDSPRRRQYAAGNGITGARAYQVLRYCLSCVREDRRELGVAYWHREHQLAGTYRCLRHPGVRLMESRVGVVGRDPGVSLERALDLGLTADPGPTLPSEALSDFLADTYRWLLDHPTPPLGTPWLTSYYRAALRARGWLSPPGICRVRELTDALVSAVGADTLAQLHATLLAADPNHWLARLVRRPMLCAPPVQHLLLLHFLDVPISSVVRARGDRPWPGVQPTRAGRSSSRRP
jgi:hypothetical protein